MQSKTKLDPDLIPREAKLLIVQNLDIWLLAHFRGDVELVCPRHEHARQFLVADLHGARFEFGDSPFRPKSAWRRSDCSAFVGRPVEGPLDSSRRSFAIRTSSRAKSRSAPEMAARIAEAESRVQAAEADRLQAEAQLAAAQSTYGQLKKASETPGAIDLFDGLVREYVAVGRAEGAKLDDSLVDTLVGGARGGLWRRPRRLRKRRRRGGQARAAPQPAFRL